MTSNTKTKAYTNVKANQCPYFQGCGDSSEKSLSLRQITIRYVTGDSNLQRGYTVCMIFRLLSQQ